MERNIRDIAGLLGSIAYSQVQTTVGFYVIVSEISLKSQCQKTL